MKVNVVWQSYHKETPPRGYWDQGIFESLFSRDLWLPINANEFVHCNGFDELQDANGAIVMLPARHHTKDVKKLNADIAKLEWCIIVLCGDEENLFPASEIEHPNMAIYLMTPQVNKDLRKVDFFIGSGFPPNARIEIAKHHDEYSVKPFDWSFAGQVTHDRRRQCTKELKKMRHGVLIETPGFTQGIPHEEYYRLLSQTRVVPCPSGPQTPDSIRLFEALEAGCIPLADTRVPKEEQQENYWKYVFPSSPIPLVDDWSTVKDLIQYHNDVWPTTANQVYAWWQGFKREIAYRFENDITRLSGVKNGARDFNDEITVLIPTSPIPSHPSTKIIDETIAVLRSKLPTAEIMIMIDGVRDEQSDRRPAYNKYVNELLWKCNFEWKNVLPVLFTEHTHQARMTRETLKLVKTPTILFVEHDTPITPDHDFPWENLIKTITTGAANFIRFHFESHILEEHKHLMLDETPIDVCGVPMMRTAQWSQRPHLASTAFYRSILQEHFSPDSRTMIEDKMHGVLHNAFMDRSKAGWNEFKVWMYTPEGDIKRSYNLDGRETDPKYDMIF